MAAHPALSMVVIPSLAMTPQPMAAITCFEGLAAGNYIVNVPASNFDNAGDPLFLFISSDGADGTKW